MAALEYLQLEIPLIPLNSVLDVSGRSLFEVAYPYGVCCIVLVSKPVASVCSRRAAALLANAFL